MDLSVNGFNWDKGNREKCLKHGVGRKVIEDFFKGEVWIGPDPNHSESEERFLGVGLSRSGRALVVAFTFREQNGEKLIRPISARYMHEKEAKRYDEAFTKDKD